MAVSPTPLAGPGSLARYTPLKNWARAAWARFTLRWTRSAGDRCLEAASARPCEQGSIGTVPGRVSRDRLDHHAHIAAAYDFGYTREDAPVLHEGVHPRNTARARAARGEDPRTFLRPILDLLDALDYLHAHGILHLDVHPGNLIVGTDPARGAVLIDFGLLHTARGSGAGAGWGDWAAVSGDSARRAHRHRPRTSSSQADRPAVSAHRKLAKEVALPGEIRGGAIGSPRASSASSQRPKARTRGDGSARRPISGAR